MWHDRRNMGIGVKHITDRKSLRDWLNALLLPDEERQRIATGLATRATLRVLPLDWPLLHDIATTDTLDWSKGPIDLNAYIMAFRDIWLAKEARAGEALYFDEEAGVFRLEVMEADDPSRLERAVFKLTEILELINATGNFSGVVKGELLLIERAVTLYPDNAFKVYNNTSQSLKLLRRNIETAACPAPADDALVDMLEMTLQEVKAMLQSEPDVISDVIPRLEKLVSEMPKGTFAICEGPVSNSRFCQRTA